jgi:crotonobetainyl-CoA:carnitine CoA-transferase CaiB-like acyl-CoA transferase
MSDGPLDGVRVLELSEGLAGPMAARLLGDAGADVVKIESAGGDRTRGWGPSDRGQTSAVFTAVNRNKYSVMLGEHDGAALTALLSSADVLIVDAGQLDVTALMEEHPDLVVGVISGWGPNGPWA